MIDDEMVAAWREAASRLGVRVVAPHSIELPDGTRVTVEALLPDFGGPHGAVAVAMDDDARCRQAWTTNHFVSLLADGYRRFEPELFRETLDDWGWFGPDESRPDWYTGKP